VPDSFDGFREEPMRIAAVERHLQKISDAAVRLGDEADILCPGIRGATSGESAIFYVMNTTGWIWTPSGIQSRIICRR
jgi:hypothetical protein